MACNYYYNTNPGQPQIADKTWVAINGGIDPDTATPAELAAAGFYCYVPTEPPSYDAKLYSLDSTWVITGTDASEDYTVVELPLPDAKANCVSYEQGLATGQTIAISTASGYSESMLTTAASLPEVSRPVEIQAVLDAQTVVMTEMMDTIAAIEAATSIDELSVIVDPPSGTFVSGRGGAGPLDMQPSYFSALNSMPLGIGEPQLEIYIPGTDTVIPYDAGLPEPYKFDSMGDCYNTGDYRTVIRVAATGQVLSTVFPAEGPEVSIDWTYDPVIPAAPGGGSSEAF
jgi:hypothetical protein